MSRAFQAARPQPFDQHLGGQCAELEFGLPNGGQAEQFCRRDIVEADNGDIARDGNARGVFSLRTPVRPNPIGTSIVQLVKVEGPVLLVRGLDCLDGTPLIDLKPDRTLFKPLAPAQAGDFQVGEA